jgi:hypothetical protein
MLWVTVLAAGMGGCDDVYRTGWEVPDSGPLERMEVDEAQQFAMENYKEAVCSHLPTPATAEFPQPPDVHAYYHPDNGRTRLTAFGLVDAENEFGALLRLQFWVVWTTAGRATPESRWTLHNVMLMRSQRAAVY